MDSRCYNTIQTDSDQVVSNMNYVGLGCCNHGLCLGHVCTVCVEFDCVTMWVWVVFLSGLSYLTGWGAVRIMLLSRLCYCQNCVLSRLCYCQNSVLSRFSNCQNFVLQLCSFHVQLLSELCSFQVVLLFCFVVRLCCCLEAVLLTGLCL